MALYSPKLRSDWSDYAYKEYIYLLLLLWDTKNMKAFILSIEMFSDYNKCTLSSLHFLLYVHTSKRKLMLGRLVQKLGISLLPCMKLVCMSCIDLGFWPGKLLFFLSHVFAGEDGSFGVTFFCSPSLSLSGQYNVCIIFFYYHYAIIVIKKCVAISLALNIKKSSAKGAGLPFCSII